MSNDKKWSSNDKNQLLVENFRKFMEEGDFSPDINEEEEEVPQSPGDPGEEEAAGEEEAKELVLGKMADQIIANISASEHSKWAQLKFYDPSGSWGHLDVLFKNRNPERNARAKIIKALGDIRKWNPEKKPGFFHTHMNQPAFKIWSMPAETAKQVAYIDPSGKYAEEHR